MAPRPTQFRRTLLLLLLCGLLPLAGGCKSRITRTNFNRIKKGMSEREVTQILGAPTQAREMPSAGAQAPATRELTWKNGSHEILVQVAADKVTHTRATNLAANPYTEAVE